MVKETIVRKGDYATLVEVFDKMKPGESVHMPETDVAGHVLRSVATKFNREARLTGELKTPLDVKFRTSAGIKEGHTTLFRVK